MGPQRTIVLSTASAKKKHPGKQAVRDETAHDVLPGSSKSHPLHAENATFDPHVFLTKLAAGKASREYRNNESVFSQGEVADAVFYIQSGKVKLTVVSKRGKEAVIAILPEASFFGEGCLTGQPFRMSTASTIQRSKIVRMEKSAMLHLAPSGTGICRAVS